MSPPTRARHVVLAGLCAAAALAYLTRNALGTAESTIRADLGLTKEQSGLMMSMFFWPYALSQIPVAALSQRLGARRTLPLFAALWSVAAALFSAGSLAVMMTARACMGIAQAALVPVGISALARWFPRSAQGSAAGAFSGFMSVGGIVAAPLTVWLMIVCGWRWMFVLYALPGILWALWFTRWFRDRPSDHPAVNAGELDLIQQSGTGGAGSADPPRTSVPWLRLITSPAMACLCAQQFCRAAGYIFFASWFATYLQEARGVTISGSGWLSTLPLLADVTGCMFGGVLSDAVLRRTGSQRLARQGISAAALLLCAGLIFSASFAVHPLAAVLIISAGMFCAALANPCFGATVMSMGGAHVAAVSATANMCGNLGAAAFPLAVPWLLHHPAGWNAVLTAFGSLYVVAATFWLLLKTNTSVFDQSLLRRR